MRENEWSRQGGEFLPLAEPMYNEHFGFTESPFNVTPDSRFFFVNPCYEEAFATLRYGIDARKGFVVITGQPGTGKTTLLKRLTCSLDSNVEAACIFDPHLTFIQLLRVTLGELGVPSTGKDRLSMMGQLYEHLIQQLENGKIVCLMIDEAQNLSVEMLEELRLLSNLETDTDKLLQIVLVGQPEFEDRLERPELVQLKQRVALRCRLRPLELSEVSLYLQSRLETIRYKRPNLFDDESIYLIALYSKGIPRLINSICDNALLIAYTTNRRYVIAQDVREAAIELQLESIQPLPNKARLPLQQEIKQSSEHKNGYEETFSPRSPLELTRAAADLPSFQFPVEPDPGIGKPAQPTSAQPEFEPFVAYVGERSSRTRMSGLYALGLSLVLIFAFGGSALFYATRQTQAWMPNLQGYLRELARLGHLTDWQRSELQSAQNRLPAPQAPAAPLAADDQLKNIPDPAPVKNDFTSVPDNSADTEIQVTPEARDKAADRATKVAEKRRAPEQRPGGVRIANDQEIAGRKLEMEVYKAISDRAITGVAIVSVSDGTVYLDGRVATPRQKLAAVRAALSVPGVKSVRDRIAIDN
jgi:general secretion pathway protein A